VFPLNIQMSKPLFLIRISSREREVTCLGSELIEILNVIHPFVKSNIWYGADIEINGMQPFKWALESSVPRKIGNFDSLVQISQDTEQFLSGTFFALSKDFGEIWNHQFFTEDSPFRNIEEAVVEIRAFDTTYFEIYSSNYEMMRILSEHFHAEIQKHQ